MLSYRAKSVKWIDGFSACFDMIFAFWSRTQAALCRLCRTAVKCENSIFEFSINFLQIPLISPIRPLTKRQTCCILNAI